MYLDTECAYNKQSNIYLLTNVLLKWKRNLNDQRFVLTI